MAMFKTIAHLHDEWGVSNVYQNFQSSLFIYFKIHLLEFNDIFFPVKLHIISWTWVERAITSGVNTELHTLSYVTSEHSVVCHFNFLIFLGVVKFSVRLKFFKSHLLSLVHSNNSLKLLSKLQLGGDCFLHSSFLFFVTLDLSQWCGSHHFLTLLTH